MVAGLTAAHCTCRPEFSSSLPCRNSAGRSVGIITLRRLEQTLSMTSHNTHSASRTAVSYRTLGLRFSGAVRGPASNLIACLR